jgi:hypothetical protein
MAKNTDLRNRIKTILRYGRGIPSQAIMRFSRAQLIGAIILLAIIWLVIAIRLIISRG